MAAQTLYLTIDSVVGGTVYLTVYRLRTIWGSRRGWFDIVELSLSRTSCIVKPGRPCSQPEDSMHGRRRELVDEVDWLFSHPPCASRDNVSHGGFRGARLSRTSWLVFPGPSQPKLFGKSGHGNLLRRGGAAKARCHDPAQA